MSRLIKTRPLLLDHYFQLLPVSPQGSVRQLPHVSEPKDESLGRWRLCGSWAMAEGRAGCTWLYLETTGPIDNWGNYFISFNSTEKDAFQLDGKQCWGRIANLHPTKPVAALKTSLLLSVFNIPEAAGAAPASVGLAASSDKKNIPRHRSTLLNLFSALFSQPCLWSLCISHPGDQQGHGQILSYTTALDEPYRWCRAISKTLLWRRT